MTCVQTDHHRDDGAAFNKGLLVNLGLAHLRHRGWIAHLDADIVLPDRLRWVLDKSRLDDDCIYGADRVNVVGRRVWRRLQDAPAASSGSIVTSTWWAGRRCRSGCAAVAQRVRLLPHRLLPALASRSTPRRRYHVSQGSAEHSDVLFALQWPARKRLLLPGLFVYHLQSEAAPMGANWQGRKTKRW